MNTARRGRVPGILGKIDNVAEQAPSGFLNTYSTIFDGVNEYVLIGDVAAVDFERTDSFSFSAWVKGFSSSRSILGKRHQPGYHFRVDSSGNPGLHMRGNNGTSLYVEALSADIIDSINWFQVITTYDGSSTPGGISVYVDGISVATHTNASTLNDTIINDDPFIIGSKTSTGELWNGNIDEVSVWDKELTADEVSEIYNAGAPSNLLTHSAVSSLVAWWRMGDNDTYPTITDNSANSHDGTMQNMSANNIVEDVI